MTESHLRLAADIDSRHVLIPFRHDGGGGLLVGAWRPSGEFSPHPPSRLKHATLYHVTDGVPGAFRLPVMRCRSLGDIDAAALYAQGISGAWKDALPRMPAHPPYAQPATDPFLALAWDREMDHETTRRLLQDATSTKDSPRVSRHDQDLAYAKSLNSLSQRVQEASRVHFIGRIDAASTEVLTFMRERLPYFTWRSFRALASDWNGPVREFAERFPLLAGRALAFPAVVEKALAGDIDGAREAALDPAIVGAWVVDAVRAFPRLAECVDGQRRGFACDVALLHVPALHRGQVPTDPGSFAAYVDACAWTEATMGFNGGEGRASRLSRMRGNWARATADCRSASIHRGESISLPMLRNLFYGMSYSFEYDLMEHALKLEGGADGPRRQLEWAMSGAKRVRAADDVAYRGMNVPDRIRHAVRYAAARPRIAAVGHCAPDCWRLFATDVLPPDWIGITQGADIRFIGVGSATSLNERCRPRAVNRRGPDERLTLPASTPDGMIGVLFEYRKPDGRDAGGGRSNKIREAVFPSVRVALTELCLAQPGDSLGDALLRHAGLLERTKEDARRAVEPRRLHLAAMQAAWGDALPRRLRRLDPDAFRLAIVDEFRAAGNAIAVPTP